MKKTFIKKKKKKHMIYEFMETSVPSRRYAFYNYNI